MNKVKLLDTCFLRTGKLDSNCATENGKYPFFTCAPTPLKIDEFAFDEDAILLAGNNAQGNFHIQRFTGKFNAYQRTYVITAKNGWDIDYIKYSIEIALNHLKRMAQGSQTKFLTLGMLESFYLKDISLQEQKKTIRLLKAVDQKISLNNRINDNLQRQLKLLYDYWFTQFDFPDETGRPYRTSGGKMQTDPTLRRPIPIGWEVKTLGDILVEKPKSDIQVGRAKTATGSFPFFTSGDTVLEWSEALVEGRNCFLNTGGNADVKFYVGAAAYSTDTWCVTGEKDFSDYLYLLLESMRPELHKKYFQGTGLKHLQKNLLKNREICIPPDAVLRAFNEQIQPMLTLISQNIRENKKLTDLRDWLLPLLMNGQATLAD